MALEYATIPAYCLPSVEAVGASLYEALEAAGHLPVRALQRLRAIAATAEQAEMLEIDPGTPGLLIERRGVLGGGRTAGRAGEGRDGEVWVRQCSTRWWPATQNKKNISTC